MHWWMYIFNHVEHHLYLYGLIMLNYLRLEDFSAIVWAEKQRKHNDVFVALIPCCLLLIFPSSKTWVILKQSANHWPRILPMARREMSCSRTQGEGWERLVISSTVTSSQRFSCRNPLPFEGSEIVIFSSLQRLLQSHVAHYLIGYFLHLLGNLVIHQKEDLIAVHHVWFEWAWVFMVVKMWEYAWGLSSQKKEQEPLNVELENLQIGSWSLANIEEDFPKVLDQTARSGQEFVGARCARLLNVSGKGVNRKHSKATPCSS